MVLRRLEAKRKVLFGFGDYSALSRCRFNASIRHARYSGSAKAPDIAFAFDIDGVLTQGSAVLPQAKRALRILNGENFWKRQFPYILMTNGGGKPESVRCLELSDKLENASMFMQSHTIIGSRVLPYLERYAEKPIMVLGGVDDTCRKISQSYGFRNVLIPIDALAWNGDLWPFYKMTDTEAQIARRDFDFESTPIEAVFIFHDPRNWGLDVQICLDIVRYGSQTRSAFQSGVSRHNLEKENPVELVFCNPDLIWRGGYQRPRLGQGGFREAFQGAYRALEGNTYRATQLGKPSAETYAHATDMIRRRIAAHAQRDDSSNVVGGYNMSPIYMIGDNPESDIAGANAAGWNSILVHTGVYSPESGPPAHLPTIQARDVEEAVTMAISREAEPN